MWNALTEALVKSFGPAGFIIGIIVFFLVVAIAGYLFTDSLKSQMSLTNIYLKMMNQNLDILNANLAKIAALEQNRNMYHKRNDSGNADQENSTPVQTEDTNGGGMKIL